MSDRILLKYLNIGYVICLILVTIQILIALSEASRINGYTFWYALKVLNSALSLVTVLILWRILVKYYDQHQLSLTFALVFAFLFLLLLFGFLSPQRLIESFFWTGWIVVALIYLVFSFVLFFKLMGIDDLAVPKIELLKNYCLASVICLFLLLILFLVSQVLKIDRFDFLKSVFIIIPWAFLSIFFQRTRRSLILQ